MPQASPAARRDCGEPSPKSQREVGTARGGGCGGDWGQPKPPQPGPWQSCGSASSCHTALETGVRGHSGSPLPAAVQEQLGGAGGGAAGPCPMKQPPCCRLCRARVLRCCGTHRTCAQVSVLLCPSPAHLPAPADASGDAPRLKPPAAARLILQLPAAERFLHVFSLHLPQNRAPPALLRFAQHSLTSPHCLHH